MSDEKLRELERKWKESGSVDDEAAYLQERVRVGDLSQERLELAARCGHRAAAVAACLANGLALLDSVVENKLGRFTRDQSVAVRLGVGLARQIVLDFSQGAASIITDSLDSVERWVTSGGGENERAELVRAEAALGEIWESSCGTFLGGSAVELIELVELAQIAVGLALNWTDPDTVGGQLAGMLRTIKAVRGPETLERVAGDLAVWLLGHH